jgi:hypothetical protein|tara:strand:- start:147 stop:377 length:231 start_codon:yes stop_codon:yes gene_type:complete
MTKSNHFWIVSGVTFCVFFTEALIHYNYGILESKNLPFKMSNFTIPKGKSMLKMASIVVVASALSGLVIDNLEQKA